jgi:hypothetical protein
VDNSRETSDTAIRATAFSFHSSLLPSSLGCPYQKLYPCGSSGVSDGEIRMGLQA